MAKKVVATLRTSSKEYTKVVLMKRSEKTGAYYFDETIVPIDAAQEFISKINTSLFMIIYGFLVTTRELFWFYLI